MDSADSTEEWVRHLATTRSCRPSEATFLQALPSLAVVLQPNSPWPTIMSITETCKAK